MPRALVVPTTSRLRNHRAAVRRRHHDRQRADVCPHLLIVHIRLMDPAVMVVGEEEEEMEVEVQAQAFLEVAARRHHHRLNGTTISNLAPSTFRSGRMSTIYKLG